jgi:hypothetical protein
VRVVVTEIGWDGSIRRSALETVGLPDAGHWEYLIEQVLAVPPRYQATPGSPVYVIHAGARAVLVGEENLVGSLHALVSTILQAGSPALAAKQPATVSIAGHTHRARPRQMPDGDVSLAQPSPANPDRRQQAAPAEEGQSGGSVGVGPAQRTLDRPTAPLIPLTRDSGT